MDYYFGGFNRCVNSGESFAGVCTSIKSIKNNSFLYLTPTIAPYKMQPKNNYIFFISAYKRAMYPLMEMAILIMNVSEMKDVLQTIHFDAN